MVMEEQICPLLLPSPVPPIPFNFDSTDGELLEMLRFRLCRHCRIRVDRSLSRVMEFQRQYRSACGIPIVVQYPGNPLVAGLPPVNIYTPSISRAAAAEHWNIDLKELEAKGYLSKTPFASDPREDFLLLNGIDEKEYGLITSKYDVHPNETNRFALMKVDKSPFYVQARRSLAEIMELPYSSFDRSTESQPISAELSFDSFVAAHPEWGKGVPGTYVFFRDHPKMKQNPLIQRVTPGWGALVACSVLQHYLVALANNGVAPTLDIACWLRKHSPKYLLEDHIFFPYDGGVWECDFDVDALYVLPCILNTKKNSIVVDKNPSFEDIPNLLRRYGPVLLDRWKAKCYYKSEECTSEMPCAVLVVGSRTFNSPESGGKQETRLLLQRWWPDDTPQFMEISPEDFQSQLLKPKGRAVYAKSPQKRIPPELDVATAIFSRCSIHRWEAFEGSE
jgi:hypothetical protein